VFDGRSTIRHGDGRRDLEFTGGVSNTLSMVAGAASDYTLPLFFGSQMGHLVVGAAQLEAKDWEEVLSLEKD